jgi:hypothetical protein
MWLPMIIGIPVTTKEVLTRKKNKAIMLRQYVPDGNIGVVLL